MILTVVLAWLLAVTLLAAGLAAVSRPSDSPGITFRKPPPVEPPDPEAWLDTVTMRKVIVHTVDDRSTEGLLAHAGPDGLVLVHARLLGDRPVDLAGKVWVDRSKVLIVQAVP